MRPGVHLLAGLALVTSWLAAPGRFAIAEDEPELLQIVELPSADQGLVARILVLRLALPPGLEWNQREHLRSAAARAVPPSDLWCQQRDLLVLADRVFAGGVRRLARRESAGLEDIFTPWTHYDAVFTLPPEIAPADHEALLYEAVPDAERAVLSALQTLVPRWRRKFSAQEIAAKTIAPRARVREIRPSPGAGAPAAHAVVELNLLALGTIDPRNVRQLRVGAVESLGDLHYELDPDGARLPTGALTAAFASMPRLGDPVLLRWRDLPQWIRCDPL